MTYENKHYYLAFNCFQKIGPMATKRLENYFSDLKNAFTASSFALEKAGLNPKLAGEFIAWRRNWRIENVLTELEKENISFITWHDPEYPPLLKEISAPPPVLYYKGCSEEFAGKIKNRLAVVGSRQHSAYAEKIIAELLPPLIAAEIEIISGLALGIDALAHHKTLDLKGKTWAILGSGLDAKNIYPSANWRLAENIIANGGLLLSEFPPGTPPYKQNFPQRNRIIAGLAQATLVVEAKAKSGALITAAYALEQNREVLAIPGNIFSEFSAGPNDLIRSGAKTVINVDDILEVFKLTSSASTPSKKLKAHSSYQPENQNEATICNLLKSAEERAEALSADEIIKNTKLDTATINSTLSILEIKGVISSAEFGYKLI
ncbi:TPA: DNA-protecting protein DprA [Candidatus Falkowbacteria bacterium]|nr:MAG: hypothetical protein UV95_C0001G0289 [Candidatus Falkowbacteria bacterium GW2011_GWF2_43_32]HBA36300.1 DNA-protecting protein DprA [Candidatus Falkowbacteria bacterium]